jgi:hypothetical protein
VNAKAPTFSITRILLLGGGFAGIYAARRLEKLFAGRSDVETILVSRDRDTFLLTTPLLFEVCSRRLDMGDCSISIREFLRNARFVEATVNSSQARGSRLTACWPAPARLLSADSPQGSPQLFLDLSDSSLGIDHRP